MNGISRAFGAAVLLAAALGAFIAAAFIASSLLESPCRTILETDLEVEVWRRSFDGRVEYLGLSGSWISNGVLVGTSALEDSPICVRVDPRE